MSESARGRTLRSETIMFSLILLISFPINYYFRYADTVPVTEIEPFLCHNCITPVCHSALRFFSLRSCVSWDVAQEISLLSDQNCMSGGVCKGQCIRAALYQIGSKNGYKNKFFVPLLYELWTAGWFHLKNIRKHLHLLECSLRHI